MVRFFQAFIGAAIMVIGLLTPMIPLIDEGIGFLILIDGLTESNITAKVVTAGMIKNK